MKRINNKGFAISTMLYGLLIMAILIILLLISIMSTNRRNNVNLVSQIEDELSRYSKSDVELSYKSASNVNDPAYNGQEYIVPYQKAGWYRIELFGASGGGDLGGRGAYTSGLIYLEENQHLYFYIGGTTSSGSGGYNGGGSSGSSKYGGGGSTDVRITSGGWNDGTSRNTRIMVAAGGGGAFGTTSAGGDGGTLIGFDGNNTGKGLKGKQTIGGKSGGSGSGLGEFGKGGSSLGGGGGSGYYGGSSGAGTNNSPSGGGGSSYIAGYAGSNSIKSATDKSHTNNPNYHEESFYFVDTIMIPGVNKGDGKAKIEFISSNAKDNPPNKVNPTLTNVATITDCLNGNSTSNNSNNWIEIQAIQNGKNLAKNVAVVDNSNNTAAIIRNNRFITDGIMDIESNYAEGDPGNKCITIRINSPNSLDEVAIWHYYADGRSYKSNKTTFNNIEVRGLNVVDNSGTDVYKNEQETATGIRYSAYQYNTMEEIPNGTYYISSALSENRFLNLTNSKDADGEYYTNLDFFTSASKQRWTINKVDNTYYTITNGSNGKVLQISDGSADNGVRTSTGTFQNYNSQLWQIVPMKNGYYKIKSKAGNVSLAVSGNRPNTTSNVTTETTSSVLGQRWSFRRI